MDTSLDILQIDIDRARLFLSDDTKKSIDSVDWKAAIFKIGERGGYTQDQVDDIEIETELLLCGISGTEEYQKELENRLKVPKSQVELLINDLNESVFKKIQEELIKNLSLAGDVPYKMQTDDEKLSAFRNSFGQNGLLGQALSSLNKKVLKETIPKKELSGIQGLKNNLEKLEQEKAFLDDKYTNPNEAKTDIDKQVEDIREKISSIKNELDKLKTERERLVAEKENPKVEEGSSPTDTSKISDEIMEIAKREQELEIKKADLPAKLFKAFIDQKEIERALLIDEKIANAKREIEKTEKTNTTI